MSEPLTRLEPGMPVLFGGDRVTRVSAELAAAFTEGDRLIVVQETGDLLHVTADDWEAGSRAVGAAAAAFGEMGAVDDGQLAGFFEAFASRLEGEASFAPIADANRDDVERAAARGRSTTRLALDDRMRHDMIEGLRQWVETLDGPTVPLDTRVFPGWSLEWVRSGLGVVGFVFEGRPNVFADATGVLTGGNTVVFRIGSDALGTARAIMEHALGPALAESGLPEGAVSLVDSPTHGAGWAMFADPRLGLAVARGSGPAVAQLGAVARQTGTPVSLHGTGGSWLVAAPSADAGLFESAVFNSLDRKVCNTLNTVCIVDSRAAELMPRLLSALDRAGERRGVIAKLHFTPEVRPHVPDDWLEIVPITRAGGTTAEPRAEEIGTAELGLEWEWEESPEVTVTLVPDVDTAVRLFNDQSPKFGASLISADDAEHDRFFDLIDAPFVGDGFTRWVDGQFALGTPELGLSNWQHGRLLGRGGILSGDSIFTVRARARQKDPDLGR